MVKHCFVLVLAVLLTQICVAQQTQTQSTEVTFKKVKYVSGEGKQRKEKDARIIFTNDKMLITDDNDPRKEIFVEIPKSIVTKLVYENSSTPKWKAPWTLFSKGKKHWLTVEYGKAETRADVILLRLNDENYQKIIGEFEGQTGLQADMIVAD